MKNWIALAALATVTIFQSPAFAGGGAAEKTFQIKLPYNMRVQWYETHRVSIYREANCEIVRNLGNHRFQVKTKTPIGTWEYVVKETITSSPTEFLVKITLEDKLKTRLSKLQVSIGISPTQVGSQVAMQMEMLAKSRLVPSAAVRRILGKSVSAVQDYLDANAR